MRETVAVFTYRRDPLLYLCLEAIRREDQQIGVTVYSDRGENSPRLREICKTWGAGLSVNMQPKGHGNSSNIIRGMEASLIGTDIVHIIEDDTILHGAGWFKWARKILAPLEGAYTFEHKPSNYAVALARMPGDPPSTWYESPCVSWNSEHLAIALQHIPDGFFAPNRLAMLAVLDAAFPKSRYRMGSGEQDGFFLRVIELRGWRTAFPPQAFASHLGFYGYNQPVGRTEPPGTFEEQVDFCRKLFRDKERRYELFGQGMTDREMAGMK